MAWFKKNACNTKELLDVVACLGAAAAAAEQDLEAVVAERDGLIEDLDEAQTELAGAKETIRKQEALLQLSRNYSANVNLMSQELNHEKLDNGLNKRLLTEARAALENFKKNLGVTHRVWVFRGSKAKELASLYCDVDRGPEFVLKFWQAVEAAGVKVTGNMYAQVIGATFQVCEGVGFQPGMTKEIYYL